jgi:hypothetical protein
MIRSPESETYVRNSLYPNWLVRPRTSEYVKSLLKRNFTHRFSLFARLVGQPILQSVPKHTRHKHIRHIQQIFSSYKQIKSSCANKRAGKNAQTYISLSN